MKRIFNDLFKSDFFDKNTWILFVICSVFYLGIAFRSFSLLEFIFRECMIFIFCKIIVFDFSQRYLRQIDKGRKIAPASSMIKYLIILLSFGSFILAVSELHNGIDKFFDNFFSVSLMLAIYFQLDNQGSIFIGQNYISFDLKVIPVKDIMGYKFNKRKEVVFYKDNKSKIKFEIQNLSIAKQIEEELNKIELNEL